MIEIPVHRIPDRSCKAKGRAKAVVVKTYQTRRLSTPEEARDALNELRLRLGIGGSV